MSTDRDCPIWLGRQYLPGGVSLPEEMPSELRTHVSFVRRTSKKVSSDTCETSTIRAFQSV